MTTIAWDSKMLAGDRQSTDKGRPLERTKVYRSSDGRFLYGAAGNPAEAIKVRDWVLNESMNAATRPGVTCDFEAIVYDAQEKKLLHLDSLCVPIEIVEPFYAIGSGCDYAVGAMHCGKTAAEAVEIASIYDINTGLGVDVVNVEGAHG